MKWNGMESFRFFANFIYMVFISSTLLLLPTPTSYYYGDDDDYGVTQ